MNQKTLESKKEIVAGIKKSFEESSSMAVVEYRGLTVSELSELRKSLKAVDATFGVYKNTLVKIANDSLGHQELDEYLTGSNAYVFSKELSKGPKALVKFSKKHPKLVIKGGILEGKAADEKLVKEVSKLPDKNGMISMFLSCLQAPISKFAATVKAIVDKQGGAEASAA
jgi:large subunit ribosomal protein L10